MCVGAGPRGLRAARLCPSEDKGGGAGLTAPGLWSLPPLPTSCNSSLVGLWGGRDPGSCKESCLISPASSPGRPLLQGEGGPCLPRRGRGPLASVISPRPTGPCSSDEGPQSVLGEVKCPCCGLRLLRPSAERTRWCPYSPPPPPGLSSLQPGRNKPSGRASAAPTPQSRTQRHLRGRLTARGHVPVGPAACAPAPQGLSA